MVGSHRNALHTSLSSGFAVTSGSATLIQTTVHYTQLIADLNLILIKKCSAVFSAKRQQIEPILTLRNFGVEIFYR